MKKRILSVISLIFVIALTIVPLIAVQSVAAEAEVTLSFASTAQRTSFSTTEQVWEQNGITFTNRKASSSSNIADYANPVRLYAGSSATISISEGNITGITVICGSGTYATALKNSVGDEATASGSTVTITPTDSTNTYEIAKFTAQVRVKSITVSYEAVGECAHENTTTDTVDATCTKEGSETTVCNDCGETINVVAIPKLDHEWDDGEVIKEATKTEPGTKLLTCQVCGTSEEKEIPAIGYTASFLVPSEAETVDSIQGLSIKLPSGSDITRDGVAYTFVGWSTVEIADTTETPDFHAPKEAFTLEDDTIFYAVYKHAEGEESESGFVKTEIGNISAGDTVIITVHCTDGTVYALDYSNGSSKAPEAIVITVDGNCVTGNIADSIKWNIETNNSSYVIYPNGDATKWLYCTNTNNGVRVGTNANKNFTIDASSGYLKNTATSRYVGVYKTNPDWRCYDTTTGNINEQELTFYVEKGGVVHYLTMYDIPEPPAGGGEECEHLNTTETITDPTCTAVGSVTVICNDCGEEISRESIEALGHELSDFVSNNDASCGKDGSKTATCSRCGHTETVTDEGSAKEHVYENGKCTVCGDIILEEYDLSGRYYIAAIRTTGNYFYMSNDLGTANTLRYQAKDSGLSTLPESISAPTASQVFVLERNDDGTYYVYSVGIEDEEKYLGWDSGNSGIFVDKESALALTATRNNETNTFTLSFIDGNGATRYLALNESSSYNFFAFYTSKQKQDLSLIPVENKFTGASLNIGTDLSVRYHVVLDGGEDINDFSVRFTKNGVTTTVTAYETSGGKYVFSFVGIAPQCMGDSIKAELLKNGQVIEIKENYSVKQYATDAFVTYPESEYPELHRLLSDMLYYGAAAQIYRGYKTDALVTEGVENIKDPGLNTPALDGFTKQKSLSGTCEDTSFSAAGVRFDYNNSIYVKIKLKEGTDISDVKVLIGTSELILEATGKENEYIAYSQGISALEFGSVATFTLNYSGNDVQTLTYSINDYALDKAESGTPIGDLALALYRYGKSAVEYDNN